MPIFEYTCQRCSQEFEAIVQPGGSTRCPACGATRLSKRLSVFAVVGTGDVRSREPGGPCGTCGDPRGPGSCALD